MNIPCSCCCFFFFFFFLLFRFYLIIPWYSYRIEKNIRYILILLFFSDEFSPVSCVVNCLLKSHFNTKCAYVLFCKLAPGWISNKLLIPNSQECSHTRSIYVVWVQFCLLWNCLYVIYCIRHALFNMKFITNSKQKYISPRDSVTRKTVFFCGAINNNNFQFYLLLLFCYRERIIFFCYFSVCLYMSLELT